MITENRSQWLESLRFRDWVYYYHPGLGPVWPGACFPVEIIDISSNRITTKGRWIDVIYTLEFDRGTGVIPGWNAAPASPRLVPNEEGERIAAEFAPFVAEQVAFKARRKEHIAREMEGFALRCEIEKELRSNRSSLEGLKGALAVLRTTQDGGE